VLLLPLAASSHSTGAIISDGGIAAAKSIAAGKSFLNDGDVRVDPSLDASSTSYTIASGAEISLGSAFAELVLLSDVNTNGATAAVLVGGRRRYRSRAVHGIAVCCIKHSYLSAGRYLLWRRRV